MSDIFNLERFVDAQKGVYDSTVQELQSGMKRGHWMWYMFPQLVGLGMSTTSQMYAIKSIDETKAYYGHSILGSRLLACTQIVINLKGRKTKEIFGHIDNLKFQSCLTLFDCATDDQLFREALVKYYDGESDQRTLEILRTV
jgi:uncharacterized protein (DUF1810 family)